MTQELKNTLKPCPFCGAEPKFENDKYRDHVFHGVITDECPIAGRLIPFEKWNTRADDREGEEVSYDMVDRLIDMHLGKECEFELDRGNIQYFAKKLYEEIKDHPAKRAQTEALRLAVEALEFYRQGRFYRTSWERPDVLTAIEKDHGCKAREALAQIEALTGGKRE